MICLIAGNFEAGNSFNHAVTAALGQHSWVTVHYLLPGDNIQTLDIALVPSQRFCWETVSLVDVM